MEEAGTGVLGQLVRPLDRVGLYVPGGSAAYPSSVLMNAIPATVAGVAEIAICTPVGKDGRVPPAVLAAAALAGRPGDLPDRRRAGRGGPGVRHRARSVRWTRSSGPATSTWPPPSGWSSGWWASTWWRAPARSWWSPTRRRPPAWVAADLLAQAEHDPLASAVCVTPSAGAGARRAGGGRATARPAAAGRHRRAGRGALRGGDRGGRPGGRRARWPTRSRRSTWS